MESHFTNFKLLWRRVSMRVAMETVIEIPSGEEDDLLIIKLKKVKLEKKNNVSFTVKTIPGDGHCIVRTRPKFSLYYGTNFRKTFSYTWVSVNMTVRKNFSKAWKSKSLTSAITTILSI